MAMICAVCEQEITSEDCLMAIESHVPKGQKGCMVGFYWIPVADAPSSLPCFGSGDCAQTYFRTWIELHMQEAERAG